MGHALSFCERQRATIAKDKGVRCLAVSLRLKYVLVEGGKGHSGNSQGSSETQDPDTQLTQTVHNCTERKRVWGRGGGGADLCDTPPGASIRIVPLPSYPCSCK